MYLVWFVNCHLKWTFREFETLQDATEWFEAKDMFTRKRMYLTEVIKDNRVALNANRSIKEEDKHVP